MSRLLDEKTEAKIASRYSLARAIMAADRVKGQINGTATTDEPTDTAFEREVDATMRAGVREFDKRPDAVRIPECVLRRALDTSAGAGLAVTNTAHHVPAVFAASPLARAGVTFVNLRYGEIMPTLPKFTPEWIEEGGEATETPGNVGALDVKPKTVSALIQISHKLMVQSPEGVDALAAEIVRACRAAVDKAVFSGTGEGGQPLGLDNLTGTEALTFTAGAPTRAQALEAWKKIAKNSGDADALRWIMPTDAAHVFKGQLDAGDKRYLLNGGALVDVPVVVSDAATAGRAYLADWRNLRVVTFGGVDLRVVKFNSINGSYLVECFIDTDFAFAHPDTFGLGDVINAGS